MIALSIRQPWAWLIVNGYKDVENRTWPTRFRGRVMIHAGATMTRRDYEHCRVAVGSIRPAVVLPSFEELKQQCGGTVGEAYITDCVKQSPSPWFFGEYGFVMRNQIAYPFRQRKGALGFFPIDDFEDVRKVATP